MSFDNGFRNIDVYYLGNNIDNIQSSKIEHFKMSSRAEETLYFATPKGEG
ncbi:UNVERIFIED_CONTAM: hypothetical protein O8I53_13635 [Campylobacter lari]